MGAAVRRWIFLSFSFSDFYNSMKSFFIIISTFTGTVSASTPLSTNNFVDNGVDAKTVPVNTFLIVTI